MYYHFSEDPFITCFHPRPHPSHPSLPPAVWAIDREKSPLYFFPRDCPRIGFGRATTTTPEDVARFMGFSDAAMVIATESAWYPIIKETKLYRYTFPPDTFVRWDDGAGYYLSFETVTPLAVQPLGDLLACLTRENVELRLTPSLKPLHDALLDSTMQFSMIRMRNAQLS
ncbi:DUF6886 family protein [Brevibacillus borstelensis]|uniref:DUF6886 family protein n=1 Tax=Brevibacillus borstelensis TaxID=45462 RepID=UPI0030C22A76